MLTHSVKEKNRNTERQIDRQGMKRDRRKQMTSYGGAQSDMKRQTSREANRSTQRDPQTPTETEEKERTGK